MNLAKKVAKQYMQKISFSEKCIYMHIEISEKIKLKCNKDNNWGGEVVWLSFNFVHFFSFMCFSF